MSSSFIVIVFVSVFVGAVTLIIRTARRQAEKKNQIRQRLGFFKVEPVDPALVERLASIMSPRTGKVKVTRMYRRDQGAHTLYDCYVDHEKNSDGSDYCTFLVGRDWSLPSLRLMPRIGGEGKGWGLLNRLTLLAVKQGGFEEVQLVHQPEFAKKYTALSRTPQEVPSRIPGDVWRDLAALPDTMLLQAEGDTVVFSSLEGLNERTSGDFETRETASLNQLMETARRLNSIFSGCRTESETARR